MLIFALAAGFTGGWSAPASAEPSHATAGCHEEAPPADHGPRDATAAQHLCLGCGVVAPRLNELAATLIRETAIRPGLAVYVLSGRVIGPDTPPPRLLI